MPHRAITDVRELLRPRTAAEREDALRALEVVRRHAEERAVESGGRPYEPSWTELIEEMRREEDEEDDTSTSTP
jgi:hypothetical protein